MLTAPCPAVFLAWQEAAWPGEPPWALWNLTAAIPGHPAGSTVVTRTLERAGYAVEEPPALAQEAAC
jgi:hypothetical protein